MTRPTATSSDPHDASELAIGKKGSTLQSIPNPELSNPELSHPELSHSELSHSGLSRDDGSALKKDGLLYNVVIPLLLLLGAIGVFFALGTAQTSQRESDDMTRNGRLRALPPVRVQRLQTLKSTGRPLYLVVDGAVVPYREARVAAEVAGRVIYKSDQCEAGSYVQPDQLLMKIDPTDHELEVQRLTRLREQEYQALKELDQEMANTQRLIQLANDDVALQEGEVERLTSLPKGFSSLAEVDQANRTLLAATQQLFSLENQIELQKKRRVRLEASEQLAATQLRAAEINLERTEIRAPIEGVIVSEEADVNTFVSRGSGLLTIEDTSKVEVASSLRMDQLFWVLNQKNAKNREGRDLNESSRSYDLPETPAIIEYELSGREGAVYRWQGRLLSYDGIGLDPVTRTVPVRVVVDNPIDYTDENGNALTSEEATPLVRGMFVRVRLLIQPLMPLVVVPSNALQPGNRIFQFIPDESVLDQPIDLSDSQAAMSSDEGSQQTPPKDASGSGTNELQPVFEPDRWQAGRVVVRRSVYPVDSLSVAPNKASPSDTSTAKLWVCEVRGADLSEDAFVVVSPLGTLEEDSFPVRADRHEMEPTWRHDDGSHGATGVRNEGIGTSDPQPAVGQMFEGDRRASGEVRRGEDA